MEIETRTAQKESNSSGRRHSEKSHFTAHHRVSLNHQPYHRSPSFQSPSKRSAPTVDNGKLRDRLTNVFGPFERSLIMMRPGDRAVFGVTPAPITPCVRDAPMLLQMTAAPSSTVVSKDKKVRTTTGGSDDRKTGTTSSGLTIAVDATRPASQVTSSDARHMMVNAQQVLQSMQSLVDPPLSALDDAPFKFPSICNKLNGKVSDNDDNTVDDCKKSDAGQHESASNHNNNEIDKLGLCLSSDDDEIVVDDIVNNKSSKKLKRPTTTMVKSSSPSSSTSVEWHGILNSIFGENEPPPSSTESIADKKNANNKQKQQRSSAITVAPLKVVPPPIVAADAEVQSPDSGCFVDDTKPPSRSSKQLLSKINITPLKARIGSIIGEVGRVSPLLSPVHQRSFPPLTYLPAPAARHQLMCQLDLSTISDSDRRQLIGDQQQPSTSSSSKKHLRIGADDDEDTDDVPLSKRIADSDSRKKGGASSSTSTTKMVLTIDKKSSTKDTSQQRDKTTNGTADRKRHHDVKMPTLSKEVPIRPSRETTSITTTVCSALAIDNKLSPPPPLFSAPSASQADVASSSTMTNGLNRKSDCVTTVVNHRTTTKRTISTSDGAVAPVKKAARLEPPPSSSSVDQQRHSPTAVRFVPNAPFALKLDIGGKLFSADYYQNKCARPIKHRADQEMNNKVTRTVLYLESVVYFILSVRALGESSQSDTSLQRQMTMIKETCDLLRQVTNRFVQASIDLAIVSRIHALSLRTQAVLSYRLYASRQSTVYRNHAQLAQFAAQQHPNKQQQQSSSSLPPPLRQSATTTNTGVSSGQQPSPTESGYGTGGGGGSSAGSNGTCRTATPSPTPSPASSTNSTTMITNNNYVSIPQHIDSMQRQQLNLLHHLMFAHRYWDEADAKIRTDDDRHFFEHLDRICGCALRIETSIADFSVYLATAVDWIRRDQPSFDKT